MNSVFVPDHCTQNTQNWIWPHPAQGATFNKKKTDLLIGLQADPVRLAA
jgi:hypothetical protein